MAASTTIALGFGKACIFALSVDSVHGLVPEKKGAPGKPVFPFGVFGFVESRPLINFVGVAWVEPHGWTRQAGFSLDSRPRPCDAADHTLHG